MKYVIIIPAHNEEAYIGRLLETVIAQDLQPIELIVVNDNSQDKTGDVVRAFAQKYPWIRLVERAAESGYAAGGKVVRAFRFGYSQIQKKDHDFLVKLDADLALPSHYFSRIADMFRSDSRLGVAGGTLLTEKDGEWVYENFSDEDHVKGAYKSWRKNCFEQIGGLKSSIGWDTADELLARFHGWNVATDTTLGVKHFRPLGTRTGSLQIRRRIGHGLYRLRYGFPISLISAIKGGYLTKPYVITGFAILYGWIEAWLRGDEFLVSKEEGRFFRSFRWQRMRTKLGL